LLPPEYRLSAVAPPARLWDITRMSQSAPHYHHLPAGSPFLGGLRAGASSVFAMVIFGSYVSIGAFAHDLGFSIVWLSVSTALVWAAPAQVIVIASLAAGTTAVEIAIAVTLSAIRLLPMVVSVLPVIKAPDTPLRSLILPSHLTAISVWIETLRLSPDLPRPARIPFMNGIGVIMMSLALLGGLAGHVLAAILPVVLVSAMQFLTPMSFLSSTVRNGRSLSERIAVVAGLVMAPALAWLDVGLDLLWAGIVGGTFAYAVHRLREARR
jgi:predicted branched-subunit amino acid permease